MDVATKKRNSRKDDSTPAISHGRVLITAPSERMKAEIFPLLDKRLGRYPWSYDMLPVDYIRALAPGSWGITYLGDRLPALCRKGNEYLRRPEFQWSKKSFNRYNIYMEADARLDDNQPWHDLMTNMIAGHIDLGVQLNPDLQIANFDRIINSPHMPPGGLKSAKIPLTRGKKFVKVIPDWKPFGVGKGMHFNFFFLEANKNTEKMEIVSRKLLRYLEIDELDLTKKYYGIPRSHFYTAFVTCKPERIQSMIKLVEKHTKGKGHPRFIFKHFPVYYSVTEELPPLDGSWFRAPWKRAWETDFRMDEI